MFNNLSNFEFFGKVCSYSFPLSKRGQMDIIILKLKLLFMMNSDFVIQRAEFLAKQIPAGDGLTQRVTNLYRRALSRDPKPQEIQIAIDYLNREFGDKNRFSNLAQILLLTNEFTFVD